MKVQAVNMEGECEQKTPLFSHAAAALFGAPHYLLKQLANRLPVMVICRQFQNYTIMGTSSAGLIGGLGGFSSQELYLLVQ